jgi:predicted DNA-binding antitoxin AbrB/MazE fold protein
MTVVSQATYKNGVLKPDQPLPLSEDQRVSITIRPMEDAEGAARLRRELALRLVQSLDQLMPFVGDLTLATHLRGLKADLANGRDILRPYPSEKGFLSVLVLIGSALTVQAWKQFTRPQLDAIRESLRLGCDPGPVGAETRNKARAFLRAAGVETTPRINLTDWSEEELRDAESD